MAMKVTFAHMTARAVTAERHGEYLGAAALWDAASNLASKTANIQWCQYRNRVCQSLHVLRKAEGL